MMRYEFVPIGSPNVLMLEAVNHLAQIQLENDHVEMMISSLWLAVVVELPPNHMFQVGGILDNLDE